ncbi:MAG TPA: hydrogenase maturation nickel metallochaperone HypA [Dehalococcoidia bacterium]|nr:hydrogenase maturation nickel metallochaperone HypA [Dehalococcoidia bacterium]
MHEQNICESLLALAVKHAEQAHATRILRIYLVVGEYSGVVDESVEFYFNFLSKGTIAEGADIEFMHIPAQLRCRNCDTMFVPEQLNLHCPNCNEQQVEIASGKEMYLESLEVE